MNKRIATIQEAERVLRIVARRPPGAHDVSVLTRMRRVMGALGDPQDRLRIIHVAGTSGKTSTAYYLSALLTAAGVRVGLSVSPYTYTLLERLQVNGLMLSERQFCAELSTFLELLESIGEDLGYLELLTAFAYWELDRLGVDYAVIESNAGGLYDATNIADRADKVCVLTDIGYDHTDVLGKTLLSITQNKAGIIYPGNTAVMLKQELGIMRAIDEHCLQIGGRLRVVHEISQGKLNSTLRRLPRFQHRNWWLAYQAYKVVASRDSLPKLAERQLLATMQTHIPGRMEHVRHGRAQLIFDGAHNPQKVRALVRSLLHMYPNRAVSMLLMAATHKDIRQMLEELLPLQPRLICSQYDHIPGLPHQARAASDIAEHARQVGLKEIVVESKPDLAFARLLAEPSPLKVVTGTLYGLGEIRALAQDE